MLRRSREGRVGIAYLLGEELLDGGEDHAAGIHRELAAQVGAALRLHRRLAQKVLAARKGAKELVVQVVTVGEDDGGRVLHGRLADDGPGIEGHGQALARTLRMPDHPDAAVARLPTRLPFGLVLPALFGDL